jgi:hypothetical protein
MPADPASLVALAVVALAAGTALLAATATWARTTRPAPPTPADVTLIIPVTGSSADLARLGRALESQTLRPSCVLFVVEAQEDPAFAGLGAALAGSSLAASVLVAGPARVSGQKCRNLAHAISVAEDGRSVVAMADADILPGTQWLADLVRPIALKRAEVVTGYRWALPMDARPATLLGAWIDRGVASLPKLPWQKLAWAGSLAFAPGVLSRLDAANLLDRSISDDLALAGAAARHRIDVLYRLRVLAPTPVSHSLDSLLGFAVRQYQMLRLHQPAVWAMALLLVAGSLLLRTGLWLAAAASAFWLKVLLAFLAVNCITYSIRLWRAKYAGLPWGAPAAEALLFLVPLLGPAVDAFHLAAILKGADTRRIDWAHLTYELNRGKVAGVIRRPWA